MIYKQDILRIALAMLIPFAAAIEVTTEAQTIKGKIYGGGEVAIVDGDTRVEVYSGVVGDEVLLDGGVFGGGLGEPTVVTGDVKVYIGHVGSARDAEGPTIYGDVYGGSALGSVNGTTPTNDDSTLVTLSAGVIHGSMYGGALGQKTGTHGATSDIAANVYGPVAVYVYGGSVFPTDGTGDNGSGGVFGANNLFGAPQRTVTVDVYGTNSAPAVGNYALFTVYGGGNQADYRYPDFPTVTVHNCDNSIEYVYGGGNAAAVQATHVTIYGGDTIGNVFGGGNGRVKAANIDDYTDVKIHGGTILSIFGGSNTNGLIGNGITITIDSLAEEGLGIGCASKINNVYGGGNKAPYANSPEIYVKGGHIKEAVYGGGLGATAIVGGMPKVQVSGGDVVDVYGGGSQAATKGGTLVYVLDSAKILGSVYGGGLGLDTDSTVAYVSGYTHVILGDTVVDEDDTFTIAGTVYGGGNMAQVVDSGLGGGTHVEIRRGIYAGDIYGGGRGLPEDVGTAEGDEERLGFGKISGSTLVTINDPQYSATHPYTGSIYGGGALGAVEGETNVVLHQAYFDSPEGKGVFGGGYGEIGHTGKAAVRGETHVLLAQGPTAEPLEGSANIYGGGDMAQVMGSTYVDITYGALSGNIFGGGKGIAEDGSTLPGEEEYLDYGRVLGKTNVLVDGDLQFGSAGAGDKVRIYGGGALGMVDDSIKVEVKSGELYGSVFAGSLGERGYVEKAKVSKGATVHLLANDNDDPLTGDFKVYGGCDLAQFIGDAQVVINHGDFSGEIYGGGNGMSSSDPDNNDERYGIVQGKTSVLYDSDGRFNGDIYGGGALGLVRTDNPNDTVTAVYLKRGELNGQVFGGSLGEKMDVETAKVKGNTLVVTVEPDDPSDVLGGDINHVFGGGNMAQVEGNTNVLITHGQFSGTIFGGGNGVPEDPGTPVGSEQYLDFGKVTGKTYVLIDGEDLHLGVDGGSPMQVYGGGALGMVGDSILVEVKSGEIYGAVFAGSLGEKGYVEKAKVSNGAIVHLLANDNNDALIGNFNVYGGCDLAQFEGNANVVINHGDFTGEIYGGGNGLSSSDPLFNDNNYGIVLGKTSVLYDSDGRFNGDIYGGGALGMVQTGNPNDTVTAVYLAQGEVNGRIFGGGLGEKGYVDKALITGNTLVTTDVETTGDISGDIENFFGGGNMASIDGSTYVVLTRGHFNGRVFGGGNGVAEEPGTPAGSEQYLDYGKVYHNSNVLIDGPTLQLGTPGDDQPKIQIYGGGALGMVGDSINIYVKSGEHYGEIFGGSLGELGHVNKARVEGQSTVHLEANDHSDPLTGVLDIYGGCDMAQVDTSGVVMQWGTYSGRVFGGGKGLNVDTLAHRGIGNDGYGNVLKLAYVEVRDGSNTPEVDAYGGCALAHVVGDTARVDLLGGKIQNVYGGGLGDAQTAATEQNTLVVLDGSQVYGSIFGCNNVNGTPLGHPLVHVFKTTAKGTPGEKWHVEGVYGGGNKAGFYPTDDNEYAQVIVENCDNCIDYVYGGGNAAPVPHTDVTIHGADSINYVFAGGNGAGAGNPGANVGWKADNITAYGMGETHANIFGGRILHIFGGSNTKGLIRVSANVNIEDLNVCEMRLGEVYGAGNLADMSCDANMTIDCAPDLHTIYGGANQANVFGNITLNIHSGYYTQVFGGNNQSGNVNGSITINVDETGCEPVVIGELYSCGNLAAYSVYGYDDDGAGAAITSGARQWADPTINVTSFTGIGTIYGAGLGASAEVSGNPTVNINVIPGRYANQIDANGDTAPDGNAQARGTIGTIFGGGNECDVNGDTYINICTEPMASHWNTPSDTKPTSASVTKRVYEIMDTYKACVYGGGRMGNINGSTHVRIMNGYIQGNVYGGGQGADDDPDAAHVTGSTYVVTGEE